MIAYKSICGSLGIIIDTIEYGINDKVVWRWSDEQKQHKSRVYYDSKDYSYIIINGKRYKMNEFIKVYEL